MLIETAAAALALAEWHEMQDIYAYNPEIGAKNIISTFHRESAQTIRSLISDLAAAQASSDRRRSMEE